MIIDCTYEEFLAQSEITHARFMTFTPLHIDAAPSCPQEYSDNKRVFKEYFYLKGLYQRRVFYSELEKNSLQ